MDLDQELNGALWAFNNYLLVIHRMEDGENPLKVPLTHVSFWVQAHELLFGFFFTHIAKQLSDFVGEFLECGTKNLERDLNNYMRIQVWLDVRRLLRRKKRLMFALGQDGKRSRNNVDGMGSADLCS
ncbi:hypothetical protein Goshw_005596, partial [Gossypium schwendimanii]|nr:hypothetical protein [Gossypium schwendimanii]